LPWRIRHTSQPTSRRSSQPATAHRDLARTSHGRSHNTMRRSIRRPRPGRECDRVQQQILSTFLQFTALQQFVPFLWGQIVPTVMVNNGSAESIAQHIDGRAESVTAKWI
jgi:hypothetical protein